MTETADVVTLTMTARDAQWLAAAVGVCTTLLHPEASDRDIYTNINSLHLLLLEEYSGTEANNIALKLRALLPDDTMLRFVDRDGPFAPSASTLIQ